jgi:hypothetical protein
MAAAVAAIAASCTGPGSSSPGVAFSPHWSYISYVSSRVLSCIMQDIEPFTQPKVQLEQYPTGADIASRMLYTVSRGQTTRLGYGLMRSRTMQSSQ